MFSYTTVLISFLNAAFASHAKLKTTTITRLDTSRSREPKRRVGQAQSIFDIWATDSHGQHYIIEMQRSFRPYEVTRFQYYAALAFCEAVQETYDEWKEKNGKAPKDSQLYPRVPNVILIVLTDKLSVKPFVLSLSDISKAEKENQKEGETHTQFSICATVEEFGSSSKMNYLFIDLERFKREALESSFEKWIHFLKSTKTGKFEKALESQYADEHGILRAFQILREEAGTTDFNGRWYKLVNEIHDAKELAKEEGIALGKEVVAERLLKRGMTAVEIATLTDLSVKEIENLRSRIQKLSNEETV